MFAVMIADDDDRKIGAVRQIIEDTVLHERCEVLVCKNVVDTLERLTDASVELLVLDLYLPFREGEDARRDGGIRVLEAIGTSSAVQKPKHIVGLTAYDDLLAEHTPHFNQQVWSLIKYDTGSIDWQEQLRRKLTYIAESRVARGFGVDLAIITAIEKPEMESVLALPADWSEAKVEGDDTKYYRSAWEKGDSRLTVVAGCCVEMGMPAATALAMKMTNEFRPRYMCIVGIAAGVSGNFGDVLVADQSYDYGSGKSRYRLLRGVVFEPAPITILLSGVLKAKVGAFSRNADALGRIRVGWAGDAPNWPLAMRVGPLASGAAVLENRPLIAQIKRHNRKLIGIEMEAYGVFMACRCCTEPRPLPFAIKSICDFADHRKGDQFQGYAAYTSSRFLFEFALDELSREPL